MWKESYRTGIETIDEQHYALFQMVDQLLRAIDIEKSTQQKKDYIATISFMKHYVVQHFSDEEAYQASIHYPGLENHKKEHRDFTATVLSYEEKFIATNYENRIVKEFAGNLVAWLIYHVAKEDQKIGKKAIAKKKSQPSSYHECFSKGVSEVFAQMVNVRTLDAREAIIGKDDIQGDIYAKIQFVGDVKGFAVFGFPKELAFELIKIMTFMDAKEMDELVCSAMAEIANIISGNAATQLLSHGIHCDIKPPIITIGHYDSGELAKNAETVFITTEIGNLEVALIK